MKDKKEAVQKDALYAKEIDLILHGDEEACRPWTKNSWNPSVKHIWSPFPQRNCAASTKGCVCTAGNRRKAFRKNYPVRRKENLQFLGMLLCILVTLLAVTVGAFYESLSNFFVEEEDDTTIVQITPAHAGKDFLMFERAFPANRSKQA